ncbi:MAG: amino acid permease [Gemmatimonadetes bacterium]|nr:amino acid permease [Gemmatimonadota bacterium]NIR79932.1 amino acid permease [Gemmatimonadota bacterium]NIT87846.1 amino acid permease [Gemmatimonadota bacterium]NIU32466.1 amino acid permease [Gemmatimonadota bacterium]NIU38093.1 amino acid permease [Gemmatimonadota bacterium]
MSHRPVDVLKASRDRPLLRVMRVRDGLAVTVGIVIGAGILRTPGLIASYLGNAWAILAVWLLGGVVAGLSTFLLAEMAAALPRAGGKYVYAQEAFGPVAGFVAGWSELLVTRAFSGAAKAVVIAEYVILLAGEGSVRILAAVVIVGFVLVHLGGIKFGTRFQNITTVIKVGVLAAIAAAGIWAGDRSGFDPAGGFEPEYGALLGFALAYQAVAFAYYGWEDAAKMAEETSDPGRALPRILIGGAAAVAVLYLVVNVAFLAALTPAEMAGSELVAADAIQGVFGDAAGVAVTVAGILILVSSLNVNFLGMPRVAYGLARDGLAPKKFLEVSPKGTPAPALYFISVLIFGLAVTGAFEWLIRFMMLVAITVDLMVLLGFFALRRSRPELERPLRVPLHPWLPALTILLYVLVLAVVVGTQPGLALGAGGMLLAILVGGVVTAGRGGGVEG